MLHSVLSRVDRALGAQTFESARQEIANLQKEKKELELQIKKLKEDASHYREWLKFTSSIPAATLAQFKLKLADTDAEITTREAGLRDITDSIRTKTAAALITIERRA